MSTPTDQPGGADASERVPRVLLGDQVASELLRDIVSGTFPPGATLPTESELALRQGVSRLTLREATGILRQKGVIEVRRGRGTYVRPKAEWSPLDPILLDAQAGDPADDLATMERLLEARRLVEIGVAELAAVRCERADLQLMASCLQLMRDAGEDLTQFVEGDIGFHDALLRAARNPIIEALFAPLRELLHSHRRSTSSVARDRMRAIRAHQAILDAVTERSVDGAHRAMAEHLRQTEIGIRRARGLGAPPAERRGR